MMTTKQVTRVVRQYESATACLQATAEAMRRVAKVCEEAGDPKTAQSAREMGEHYDIHATAWITATQKLLEAMGEVPGGTDD